MNKIIVALSLSIIAFVCVVHRRSEKPSYVDGPGTFHTWAPHADYHLSVCSITCGTNGGSGVYVQHEDMKFVLTAGHVANGHGKATVTFRDGTSVDGHTVLDKHYVEHGNSGIGWDVAAVLIPEVEVQALTIGEGVPAAAEICGFGGPLGKFGSYNVSIEGVSEDRYGDEILDSDGRVVNGDSGGPWIADGKVIGISSSGNGHVVASLNSRSTVYAGGLSAHTDQIRDFASRVNAKHCEVAS